MPRIAARTEVYVPPDVVCSFLLNFPGYAKYSPHLADVRQYGDGGPGTEYELDVTWWILDYTGRTAVTEVDAPHRIEWEVVSGLDAHGAWYVDRLDEERTQVELYISYSSQGSESVPVSLPRFISVNTILNRVKPVVRREARKTVERIVADLEGAPRSVDVEIDTNPPPRN